MVFRRSGNGARSEISWRGGGVGGGGAAPPHAARIKSFVLMLHGNRR